MKLHNYIIKHTKTDSGKNQYSIYHLWLGFIKFPFFEKEVVRAVCDHCRWQVYTRFYVYSSEDEARESLNKYLKDPWVKYKGIILTRCHGDMWIAYCSGERPRNHDWFEYEIGGNFYTAKQRINMFVDKKKNRKFKEYIDVQ